MIIKKTDVQIRKFIAENSHRLDKPELWIGCEPNTYGPWGQGKFYKDHNWFFNPANDKENVRFVHMCCWDVIQTAGNQTVPLLNQICNDRDPRILAERGAFPPTRKDVKIFSEAGIPAFSLESKHCCFTDFDVVGTTLAFPGFWPNLVKQFRDSGVPPRWEDRDKTNELYPVTFCGGQVFAQPGPIYPIIDVVVIGEAEDGYSGSDGDTVGFPTLLLDVIQAKADGRWYSKEGRVDLMHQWARDHHWLWMPRFYEYRHRDPATAKKHFIGWNKIHSDIPDRPKRRWIKNLDEMPSVVNPIINASDPSMGLGEIEASRSCTGKCSFCAEIYRYAPYREKSVENLVAAFTENVRMSGSTNAFPTGFDFPCYSRRRELYYRLTTEVCSEVDTQSSRVDHFVDDPVWAQMAGKAGMRQLAVGVEGNSERLRQIMSKGCTEEKIIDAVKYAIESKFDKVKFFMIADWEWECTQDTDEIIELGAKLVELRKSYGSNIRIRFSWTPLLVEGWTPLQWCRAVVEDKKLVGVYDRLKPLGIEFSLGRKTERNYYYFMQAFHMADPLLAEVMLRDAERHDQVYCGAVDRKWVVTMEEEMSKIGLTWDHYFRQKDLDEDFWWDIIDIDIPKKWFLDYHRKMKAMIDATDPNKLGMQPHREDLVAIGQAVAKTDKSLRLQTHLLEKGQLVGNCDTVCSACMACETGTKDEADPTKINSSGKVDFYKDVMNPMYWKSNQKTDEPWGHKPLEMIDDFSYTGKVRVKVNITHDMRFMPNDYWVACIRRAAYMADLPIGKRAIKMTSDVHGFRPWIAGTDYVEIGYRGSLTMDQVIKGLNANAPIGMSFDSGMFMNRSVNLVGSKDIMGLFEYELDCGMDEAKAKFHRLMNSTDFEMSMKREEYRAGMTIVKLKVFDWLLTGWLVRDGHKLKIEMMMKYGEPTPYHIIGAVFGMSESDCRSNVVALKDLYSIPPRVVDFFTPSCINCGDAIPVNVVGVRFHDDYCPVCLSANQQTLVTSRSALSAY